MGQSLKTIAGKLDEVIYELKFKILSLVSLWFGIIWKLPSQSVQKLIWLREIRQKDQKYRLSS